MGKAIVMTQARIPVAEHEALKEEAHERRISMNRMLVEILKERYGDEGVGPKIKRGEV